MAGVGKPWTGNAVNGLWRKNMGKKVGEREEIISSRCARSGLFRCAALCHFRGAWEEREEIKYFASSKDGESDELTAHVFSRYTIGRFGFYGLKIIRPAIHPDTRLSEKFNPQPTETSFKINRNHSGRFGLSVSRFFPSPLLSYICCFSTKGVNFVWSTYLLTTIVMKKAHVVWPTYNKFS